MYSTHAQTQRTSYLLAFLLTDSGTAQSEVRALLEARRETSTVDQNYATFQNLLGNDLAVLDPENPYP